MSLLFSTEYIKQIRIGSLNLVNSILSPLSPFRVRNYLRDAIGLSGHSPGGGGGMLGGGPILPSPCE